MKYYLGIDPGKSGSMTLLDQDGEPVDCIRHDKATHRDKVDWLRKYADKIDQAVIEKVHAMPAQGVSSTFKFGESYGISQGLLFSAGIPFDYQTPRTWQKYLSIKKKQKSESSPDFKRRLKGVAQRMFPDEKIINANADAYLIAEFCRRKYGNVYKKKAV